MKENVEDPSLFIALNKS